MILSCFTLFSCVESLQLLCKDLGKDPKEPHEERYKEFKDVRWPIELNVSPVKLVDDRSNHLREMIILLLILGNR